MSVVIRSVSNATVYAAVAHRWLKMAWILLYSGLLSMKSNRFRLIKPIAQTKERFRVGGQQAEGIDSVRLEDLPAPLPIAKVTSDQLIEDILISTLRRVQENSSPQVAAAAARYISLLSEKAL